MIKSHTILTLFGMLLLCGLVRADDSVVQRVSANITYRIPEGVYINAGTDVGLEEGITGSMVLESGQVLAFEVLHAAHNTALLRLRGAGEDILGSLQDRLVDLEFTAKPSEEKAGQPSSQIKSSAEPFVPLLAPEKRPADFTSAGNVSHGHVGVQQTWQAGTDDLLDYGATRVYSSGTIDRLFDSLWSLSWSGNLRYRTGDGYAYHPHYNEVQPLVHSVRMQHPLAGDGFVRLGRFLPLELPGIGYIDGGQVEIDQMGRWHFGFVGGLRPELVDLQFSPDEPTVVGYTTFEAGDRGSAYYSGTAGLLGSFYKGNFDRLAVLLNQRAGLGPKFDLYSSAEYDFGVADTTNSQPQLSRFDLLATSRLHQLLTLRAGAGHWQRTDTDARRDQFLYLNDALFDDGFWRYWAGARHNLPLNLDLDEEVSYIVSDTTEDTMRWQLGITRTGLFGWSAANVGARVYNLEAQDASGYGGLLRAYLPFFDSRFTIRPSVSMRWLDPDSGADGLEVTYYSIYGDARLSRSWTLSGGLTVTGGDGADAILFDAGLRYSW